MDSVSKLALARYCVRALTEDIKAGRYKTPKDLKRAEKALEQYKAELAALEQRKAA